MKIPEILLIETEHKPGSLARVLQVVGESGLLVENLNAVRRDQDRTVWELTLEFDETIDTTLIDRIDGLSGTRVIGKSDRVFDRHRGGKIEMVAKVPLTSVQQLRDIYTPGVARVCLSIRDDPALARVFTNIGNTVAVVTNGTAVLGLGNIGALAGLPVMEGKAALFWHLAGISGIPILIDETDPARLADVVAAIAPGFGAIQLEDIAAPACFEVEDELQRRLDRPVLHDDQHGTAVVTLAALIRATRQIGRNLDDCVVGQIGLGAAGMGIARLLIRKGVRESLGTDVDERAYVRFESIGGRRSSLEEIMRSADIVIATTGKRNLIPPTAIRSGQIILALTNPDPEIEPVVAIAHGAAVAADGKSVNNVSVFPGLFRGALDAGAARFSAAMLIAAAETLAAQAPEGQLVPDPLDRGAHRSVAAAVRRAAEDTVLAADATPA
ncbi:MAG TPA: malic enzyme-like NAD(P)-binding protein [Gemmatimonadota bacterium]|nr:malic enzyme-like NAD(P)-binding protein [Gemmatimonadota bacterium]